MISEATLDAIIKGLNSAGFSKRECRVASEHPSARCANADFVTASNGGISIYGCG